MPNLETLLANMGVRITVVCWVPDKLSVLSEIHELTAACDPVEIVSVSIRIKGESNG